MDLKVWEIGEVRWEIRSIKGDNFVSSGIHNFWVLVCDVVCYFVGLD